MIGFKKYKNKPCERMVNGKIYKLDSQAEAEYFDLLYMKLKGGKIERFKMQPKYEIANAYRIDTDKTKSKKSKIGALKYAPDFEYIENGKRIVVEVKGKVTTDYRMRLKLFLSIAWEKYRVDEFIEVIAGVEIRYYPKTIKKIKE